MRAADYADGEVIPGSTRHTLAALWRSVNSVAPRALWTTVVLSAVVGATEWIGLLMLVPLLGVVNVRAPGADVAPLAAQTNRIYGALHLPSTLPVVLALFVLAISMRAVTQRAQAGASLTLSNEYVHYWRVRLFSAMTGLRWPEYTRRSGGELLHALTEDVQRVETVVTQLPRIITHLLVSGVYVWLATRISLTLTLLAGGAGLLLLSLLRFRTGRAFAQGMRLSRDGAELNRLMHEGLAGMRTTRTFGAEQATVSAVAERSRKVGDAFHQIVLERATISAMFTVGAAVILSLIIYFSLEVSNLGPAAILMLLLLFARLTPRFADLQQSYQLLLAALPAFVRTEALAVRLHQDADTHQDEGDEELPRLARMLELTDVTFRYERDALAPQLSGVSLRVPAGTIVAVTGASGAGKSTLADIVLALIAPSEGALLIDGRPLRPGQVAAWRRQVGYMPQEAFLLRESIRANLQWGTPDADETRLWEALEQAAAAEFVRRLPQGMDTVVGERGATLSGGERQRIALARALVRRPSLLVLDEATSALDAVTEAQILDVIQGLRGQMTIVMVTHRPSAVARADLVCTLDSGRMTGMHSQIAPEAD